MSIQNPLKQLPHHSRGSDWAKGQCQVDFACRPTKRKKERDIADGEVGFILLGPRSPGGKARLTVARATVSPLRRSVGLRRPAATMGSRSNSHVLESPIVLFCIAKRLCWCRGI